MLTGTSSQIKLINWLLKTLHVSFGHITSPLLAESYTELS